MIGFNYQHFGSVQFAFYDIADIPGIRYVTEGMALAPEGIPCGIQRIVRYRKAAHLQTAQREFRLGRKDMPVA